MKNQIHIVTILCLLTSVFPALAADQTESGMLDRITLPNGFKISVFADNVDDARSLAIDDRGIIYVGTLNAGNVYALRDTDGDGVADERYLIAKQLNMPNGVTILNGALYVATLKQLLRWKSPAAQFAKIPDPEVLVTDFPDEVHHGWRYLKAGPDNLLYMSIGAPCNTCKKPNPVFGTLIRMNSEGKNREIIAKGVRNSLGMDWHPDTGELYFNEHGRDSLGDDIPPDELNHLTRTKLHFGFPYCHGTDIADKKYGDKNACAKYEAPVWNYPAHIAPLGLHFYRGKMFPKHYQGNAFVAQHGSHDRTIPHGFRVAMIHFENAKPVSEAIFAEGWLQADGEVLGRPADILELADGSLLVSDDKRGVIYRITYEES